MHPCAALRSAHTDGPQSEDLLRPVFMGCATKNAKVVAISLASLQRLIALKAVPQSVVPLIITTISDSVSQGVDIQLRILQTLLSLITNFPVVHGALLGDVSPQVSLPSSWSLMRHQGIVALFQAARLAYSCGIVHRCCYAASTSHVRCGQSGR